MTSAGRVFYQREALRAPLEVTATAVLVGKGGSHFVPRASDETWALRRSAWVSPDGTLTPKWSLHKAPGMLPPPPF